MSFLISESIDSLGTDADKEILEELEDKHLDSVHNDDGLQQHGTFSI